MLAVATDMGAPAAAFKPSRAGIHPAGGARFPRSGDSETLPRAVLRGKLAAVGRALGTADGV